MAYPSSGVFSNLLWDNVDSSAMDDGGLKWRHQDVLSVTGTSSVVCGAAEWHCWGVWMQAGLQHPLLKGTSCVPQQLLLPLLKVVPLI